MIHRCFWIDIRAFVPRDFLSRFVVGPYLYLSANHSDRVKNQIHNKIDRIINSFSKQK